MELIEILKKSSVASHIKCFPNSHFIAVSALSICLGIASLVPSNDAKAAREIKPLALPEFSEDTADVTEDYLLPEQSPNQLNEIRLVVGNGDTLSSLFKQAGLNDRTMMNFMASAENSSKLNSIRPGHNLVFSLDHDKKLHKLQYISSKLKSYAYSLDTPTNTEPSLSEPSLTKHGYSFSEETRVPDIKLASRSGTIENSLYVSGVEAGIDEKLIMELAEVFGWDIDFALDIRNGDRFSILYEEQFLDGEKIANGAIVSAEFTNQSQSFKAVRYTHSDGRAEYYTPEGRNMRKAFLRAPVDFRRISGSFNPKRLHPITKTVRPHRGIDYAANTGTPVWSSGDGKVLVSGYSKYNGNYVVIQHGNNIQTKYLHLHKRKVKTGQRVRQKQIIGTVGTTGLSTGPHLHYEFLLNGVHRNPRTIVSKLPKADSISAELKADFQRQTAPLIAQLIEETSPTRIALNSAAASTNAL